MFNDVLKSVCACIREEFMGVHQKFGCLFVCLCFATTKCMRRQRKALNVQHRCALFCLLGCVVTATERRTASVCTFKVMKLNMKLGFTLQRPSECILLVCHFTEAEIPPRLHLGLLLLLEHSEREFTDEGGESDYL